MVYLGQTLSPKGLPAELESAAFLDHQIRLGDAAQIPPALLHQAAHGPARLRRRSDRSFRLCRSGQRSRGPEVIQLFSRVHLANRHVDVSVMLSLVRVEVGEKGQPRGCDQLTVHHGPDPDDRGRGATAGQVRRPAR